MSKLAGKITIGRPSRGDGQEMITIKVTDEISRSRFLEVQISPDDFARAITGLSEVPCALIVEDLHNVGFKKVTEKREMICPIKTYSRSDLVEWLIANGQEEGWILNSYLGSQGSATYPKEGGVLLKYTVHKYVKPEVLA